MKLQQALKVDTMLSKLSNYEFTRYVEYKCGVQIESIAIKEDAPVIHDNTFVAKDEHELIVYLTPIITQLCTEAGLSFVNSEEISWIRVQSNHADNYQKPDGFSSLSGLFIPEPIHRESELRTLRNANSCQYLFGKGIWEIKDMYIIWDFKLSINDAAKGNAYSYAVHLSRNDKFNLYHVILGSLTEFYIIFSRHGLVTSVKKGYWRNGGSRKAIMNVLKYRNKWLFLVETISEILNVAIIGFLGSGRCGRCFKVRTTSGDEKVLKVVLTLQDDDASLLESLTCGEYYLLTNELREIPNVVQVVQGSLRRVYSTNDLIGLGYLMNEVGKPFTLTECKTREVFNLIIVSLNGIHNFGFYHGDARISNVISYQNSAIWVDFMTSSRVENDVESIKINMRNDLAMLVKSIFGQSIVKSEKFELFLQSYQGDIHANLRDVYQICMDYEAPAE